MKRIVIAGGIGSGKSAVCEYLAAKGFEIVDADLIARDITTKGTPAWQALRDAFGDAILDGDGSLDRAFLAEIVFHDPTALRRLNAITHAQIGAEMARQLDSAKGEVSFVAIPLYRPETRAPLRIDEVWALAVEPATALRRLCEGRGFSEDDARARLANQMTNEERAAIADRVLWNEGSLDELYAQVDFAVAQLGADHG